MEPVETSLSLEAQNLLKLLQDCHDKGASSMACDGELRGLAHELEDLNLATWHGTCWGSSFYYLNTGKR